LCTANAVYSFEDLYDNFFTTFENIDLEKRNIQNILVLGFGLGSIPTMLEKNFGKKYDYTAVEIDESVIYLASKYALPQLDSKVEIICANAYSFVMQCQQKFDLICMDVFLDDTVPSEFEQSDFLEKLKTLINPEGILLYNRMIFRPKARRKTEIFFDKKFKPVFPEGSYLEVKGNWMLMNRNVER